MAADVAFISKVMMELEIHEPFGGEDDNVGAFKESRKNGANESGDSIRSRKDSGDRDGDNDNNALYLSAIENDENKEFKVHPHDLGSTFCCTSSIHLMYWLLSFMMYSFCTPFILIF